MFNICSPYLQYIDERHRAYANRRFEKSDLPWNATNPYDRLEQAMQPPDTLSDTTSTSGTSAITTGSRSRRQSTRLPSTPRTQHIQGLMSSQLGPDDSVSQAPVASDDGDEEVRLLADIVALQRKKRIRDLIEQRRQLALELGDL
jgi:hypothetical protein